MGADVIEIRPPGAPDPIQDLGAGGGRRSPFFWTVHARNKRCVTLNLRKPRGRGCSWISLNARTSSSRTFAPALPGKVGLGYEGVLRQRNPGIILVRVSGYGQTGPDAEQSRLRLLLAERSAVQHMGNCPIEPPPRLAFPSATPWPGCSPPERADRPLPAARSPVRARSSIALARPRGRCWKSTMRPDAGEVVRGPPDPTGRSLRRQASTAAPTAVGW